MEEYEKKSVGEAVEEHAPAGARQGDPWQGLRNWTDARIALGRSGVSLPLSAWLDFRLAQARAHDAVMAPFDMDGVAGRLAAAGICCLRAESAASDKQTFLLRPDLGRRLSAEGRASLETWARENMVSGDEPDIVLVLSNGLSARAIHDNAVPFVLDFAAKAKAAGLKMGPVVVVNNGRVAVADEVGFLLHAGIVAILVGERPGLSSPNSMGIYMTYAPRPGCTDEARNCISNVRQGGLSIEEGVRKFCYLVQEAVRLGLSGVALKDNMPANYLPFQSFVALDAQALEKNGENRVEK